ncbi:MAG: phosphopantetheine-binding protein [Chloroflexia bacterium]
MSDAACTPLSFQEFRRLVAQELQVDETRVVPEASFIADLQVDSIRLVELLLRLEEAGIHIPLEEAWDVETAGDAYALYLRHLQAGQDVQSLPSLP